MILTPYNSTNPLFWGKDLKYANGQNTTDQMKLDFPIEFDFFNLYCGKEPQQARLYYEV